MQEVGTVPLVEVIKGAIKFVDNPIPVVSGAIEEYGHTYITRIIGGRRLIMSSDLEVAKHVLQTNNKNFAKSELQTDSMGKYVGNGLLTANGEYWLRQRRLIQPSFYKKKLESLVQIMADEIDSYCKDLFDKVKVNPEINISEEMMELTLRIVSKSLFSTGISSDQIKELGRAFTELQEDIIHEIRRPYLNWYKKLSGKLEHTKALARQTRRIMQDLIDERRRTGLGEHDDLLDMLLLSTYEDTGESMTDLQILDEAIILFVAGHETTAISLAYTLYEIHRHDNIRRATIDSATELESEPNWDFTKAVKGDYLMQVIEESLRYYPPAWILDRKAIEDDQVGTLKIKKDDLLGIYVYGIHHDERFHENPSQFDPDRMTLEEKKKLDKYAFFPFGAGPRMCIGHHFAIMEMKMVLAKLLDKFSFENTKDEKIDFQPLITLRPRHEIHMKVHSK